MTPEARQQHDALVKAYVDKGKLIAAGFATLRQMVIPESAPTVQVEAMQMAFFAGAQHLFGSILSVLDPSTEPTAADFKALEQIEAELSAFAEKFKLLAAPAGRTQ